MKLFFAFFFSSRFKNPFVPTSDVDVVAVAVAAVAC